MATDSARGLLQRMIATLHHRGPDGSGVHVEDGIGLAHARLSIIDLEGGAQPMASDDGALQLVFNGEIFNYIELRRELQAQGHEFRTDSDTEVLLHLYRRDGEELLHALNGQFAIALWDRARRRLLLARDGTGIRPLFHASHGGRLYFASEVKALLEALPQPPCLDVRRLAQAFTFWAPLEPGTVYQGIHSLPPGCVMLVEADGRQQLRRWWDWSFPDADQPRPPITDLDSAAAELRELLIDAVRLQLRADVPVGAYLSGGLDSSAIAALATRFTDTPLRTFSVSFDDAQFDERPWQDAMVAALGTEHTRLHCREADIGRAFPRFVAHAETPVLRTAGVPLMLLSASVREHGYKVVLTGEGADEVFAGYDLFKEAAVRRFWARQPDCAWRPRLLDRLYPWLPHSPVGNAAMAQSFFGQGVEHLHSPTFAHLPRWNTSRRALALLAPELRAQLAGFDPLAECEASLPAQAWRWHPQAQAQYVEAHTLLSGYLLSSQGDRVAMANSVEARYPFLDPRVIAFASALPAGFKLCGLREKQVLRRAMHGLLPDAVAQRVKQPFRAPDSRSFFVDGRPLDYVADALAPQRVREAGFFDAAAVTRLLEKCRRGLATGFADNQAFTGVLSTMLLHERRMLASAGSQAPALEAVSS